MNNKYTHIKGIVYLNQYHIVFCPKYRRKVLVGSVADDLRQLFDNLCTN
jgi:putative transposase